MNIGNSQIIPICINLVAAIIGAFGQYFYKLGAARLKEVPLWFNWQIAIGALLFTLVMVLFVASFKLGGRLSVVFPVYASTFLWGTLIGVFWENESLRLGQTLGILLVIVGIICITVFQKA